MNKNLLSLGIIMIFFFSVSLYSQDVSSLKNVDVNSLSDAQISAYWSKMTEKGYTLDQLTVLGEAQGISPLKIASFKRRVSALNNFDSKERVSRNESGSQKEKETESFGLTEKKPLNILKEKSLLFGYDFFTNSKVSFAPNVNIAVPENYQIGPGDELMIDLWGAAEVTYVATVNNNGSIKINGVGFIYVNGFTLENATNKILSKLKSKHSGITASKNSYAKIYTNVTVSKIRTVQVNIIGEVKAPGTYALNSLSSVLNALYVAGGPTEMGTFREVQLIRNNKQVATLDIYQYMLFGTQKGNVTLQDQDVLLVTPYKSLVTVEGAVKRPGMYELKEGESLYDLIQYFGGFASNAYTKLLLIERFNGSQKEVKEVSLNQAAQFLMKSGDEFVVQEVLDRYQNRVSLEGEVYRPGSFELIEGMTLKDLLLKAEGITPEAFLERGLLVRSHDDTQKENIPFSVNAILQDKEVIAMQAKDSVKIFNKEELREKRTLTIGGAVNKPGTIDFVGNLQIEDLIAISGGLSDGADPEKISVSRRLKDGSFVTLSDVFAVSSDKNLAINNGSPFYLEPFDIVEVRNAKGYVAQKNVTIEGEVNYEGSYVLRKKNERISDLILRAGGFTPFAYLNGATLIREVDDTSVKQLEETLEKSLDDFEAEEVLEQKSSFSVAINLEKIMYNKGSAVDLFLEEGDVLKIPTKQQTVRVSGMVLQPSLVPFTKKQNLRKYIAKSGGFAQKAKRNKVYVSYANGDIKTVRSFFFFKVYPKINAGATIFVPEKSENKDRMSTTEIVGITSSLATLGILIQTLVK
ncbi:SLBB domain-containing protein [uncultured Polaribacter sp.]|uniref:SLBB domain-containing protein n=1 Tax=uncultured Polaribacter sp. TaxID=174711 RepID=UPI0026091F02|nr:SLBB domain-containing protein [uncultured Polaribacter sp.]